MKHLSTEEVVYIHDRIITATGGSEGLKDERLLQSICEKPKTTLFDKEQYTSVYEKAAVLDEKNSAGVQIEIGIAIGVEKQIVLVCPDKHVLSYFNNAIVESGTAHKIELTLTIESLQTTLNSSGN